MLDLADDLASALAISSTRRKRVPLNPDQIVEVRI